MNTKKSSPCINVSRFDDGIVLSLSITLRARQRIKMGFLRKNISDYIDSVSDGQKSTCSEILQKKSPEYQKFVQNSGLSYLKYLDKAGRKWIKGKSLIPHIYFPIHTVQLVPKDNLIVFPPELDFDTGFFNHFSFEVLEKPPEESVSWARLIFNRDLVFCELKVLPYMLNWEVLSSFNLFEIVPNEGSPEGHEALPTGSLPE